MLESVPSNICELKSLEHVYLSGCSKLHGLPDNIGNLEALKELDLTSCGIEELPNNLGQLSTLRSLLLGRNFFKSIPTSIVKLSKLSHLDLSYCERLEILPELPSKLENIDASNCRALEAASKILVFFFGHITQSIKVNFSNCFKLDLFAQSKNIEDFGLSLNVGGCICFPGWEIPEWFNIQKIGSFITLEKQANLCSSDLNFLLICVVVEFRNYHSEGEGLVVGFECVLTRENGIMDVFHGTLRGWDYGNGPDNVDSDHVFLGSDNALKFSGSDSIENHKYCEMTIRFYVENLNIEKLGCC
ncbi:hypothetical protein Pint_07610 [Pistacia integerrima]|uniref:Uncharacterized protein n=1 Tax=Pistacia integerrima TaxID=434235 RepID=A0ACC0XV09_9ROSI|nr:hypothetical protein Pint_07610 [Pistacia integerrima]